MYSMYFSMFQIKMDQLRFPACGEYAYILVCILCVNVVITLYHECTQLQVVCAVTFSFSYHSYGLLGPSGCGKTTLLRCILGRLKLNKGKILALGGVPGSLGHTVPGRDVGYMPQVSTYMVGDNVFYDWNGCSNEQ